MNEISNKGEHRVQYNYIKMVVPDPDLQISGIKYSFIASDLTRGAP